MKNQYVYSEGNRWGWNKTLAQSATCNTSFRAQAEEKISFPPEKNGQ